MLSNAGPASAQTFNWKSVNIQGTGYVTGLIIHPNTAIAPNTIYARCDTVGAYRYDLANEKWIPILDAYGVVGVESIAVDPAVANTVYLATVPQGATYGDVLVSTDKGGTWGSTGMSGLNVTMSPNAYYRGTTGERLMVDPQKSGLIYFGSRQNGLYKKDGAGAWTHIGGGLPAAPADPGYTFVAFDKSSGTVGGATKTIYVGVWGSGVWRSTDAGSTWSNIGGGTGPSKAVVSSTGVLYVVYGQNEDQTGGGTGSVCKYSAGAWTNITPNANNADYTGISMDPTNSSIIMVSTLQEVMFRTTNGGTNWTQLTWNYSGQPAYLGTPGGGYGSGVVIDPNNTSHAWHTNGYGAVRTDNIAANPVVFNWRNLNLEELVTHVVRCPPYAGGADLLTGAADMIGFRNVSRDAVPTAKIGTAPCGVGGANSMDYCYTQPQYSCFVGWDQCYQTLISGYTGNNGASWSTFAGPGISGEIAMSATNPQNMVWAPTNSAQIVYTTNGGATWTACGGITTSWQASLIWCSGKILAADRVNGSKFYYFDNANFYISTNGGASWTVEAGGLPTWYALTDIVVNPTTQGDVWMTFTGDPTQAPQKAYRSTNGGVSFSAVTTMDSAKFMAFGKGSSSTNPYIYILGRVGGATKDGIYQSTNMGASWVLISDPNQNIFNGATCMEADMRTQNIVYLGQGGRGYTYGQAAASPPPAPSGLTATAGNSQISLSWGASSGATSYNVKRSTTSGSGYATVSSPGTTSYTNTGLTNGTTYYYIVTAVSSGGESGNSNQASAMASGGGGSLGGAHATSPSTANLTTLGTADWSHWGNGGVPGWDHKSSGGSQISNYTTIGSGTLASNPAMITTYSWSDGTPNSSGSVTTGVTDSGLNNGFSLTAPADTTQRTLTVYVGGYLGYGTFTAHLSDGSAVDYVDASQGNATSGFNVAYTLTYKAASAGKTLTVTWKTTTDSSGNGTCNVSLQAAYLVGAGSPPPTPTNLNDPPGNQQVSLTWNSSTGATSYNIKRSTVSGGPYTTVGTSTTTSFTNTGLTNGTAYYFVVSAVNGNGESANSAQTMGIPIDPNVHTGTWSCKAVVTGTPGYTNFANTVNVAGSSTYVASFWIKGSGSVKLKVLAGNWGAELIALQCNATSTWTQWTTGPIATGANTQLTYVVQDSYTTAGTLYIDDTFLGISGGSNTLVNVGFESGNTIWAINGVFSILQNP